MNVKMPQMSRFHPREDMPSQPYLSPNDKHVLLTAYGPDSVGQIASLTKCVSDCGGQLSAVKVITIGEDICMMLVVSMPIDAVETVTDGLAKLEENLGIQIATTAITPTEPGDMPIPPKHRARIQILGHDQSGVLKGLTEILENYGFSVKSLESRIYHSDPEEGDEKTDELLFHLEALVETNELPNNQLHDDLSRYGSRLGEDTEVNFSWMKSDPQKTALTRFGTGVEGQKQLATPAV